MEDFNPEFDERVRRIDSNITSTAKEYLSLEDFKQYSEAIPSFFPIMARAFSMSEGMFKQVIQARLVSADNFFQKRQATMGF